MPKTIQLQNAFIVKSENKFTVHQGTNILPPLARIDEGNSAGIQSPPAAEDTRLVQNTELPN